MSDSEVLTWIETQRMAVCAEAALEDRGDNVLRSLYLPLLERGLGLPFSVVVDLACLYREGPNTVFRRPASWPLADAAIAEEYCASFRDAKVRGRLRELLGKLRGSKETSRPLTFLEL